MTQNWSCAKNAKVLDKLLYSPISYEMASYVSDVASTIMTCDPNALPPTKGRFGPKPSGTTAENNLPPLAQYIYHVARQSEIPTSTFLSSLVFLRRINSKINSSNKKSRSKQIGFRCSLHRILLGSLILADKALNDECHANCSWAAYSIQKYKGYIFDFSTFDITSSEQQLLSLLDWNTHITTQELEIELLKLAAEVQYSP